MKLLTKASHIFDCILDLLGIAVGILIIMMMLTVCYEIVIRTLLRPTQWVLELNEISLLYITFLGTAWLLQKDGHVKIDLVINKLNPRVQAILNTISSVLAASLFFVVTAYSARTTWNHFKLGLFRGTVLNIPNAAILWIIPIGSLLLATQLLRRAHGYMGDWKRSSARKVVERTTSF